MSHEIFDHIDTAKIGFGPIDFSGILKNIKFWRRYIGLATIVCAISWAVFGWEGTWNQLYHAVLYLPRYFFGQITLNEYLAEIQSWYGIGQHFSTVVIYGACFLILSKHLERNGFTKSRNFILTGLLTFFSVGIYEVTYNILYGTFQNQPWVISFAWRQGANLACFIFFIITGALSLLYLYTYNFKPNLSKPTILLLSLSIITYLLWIFFPFPTATLAVQTTAGVWSNTPFFPQTMYAIDVDPLDGIAVGEPIYVENNILHLINVLNKLFTSLAILNFSRVRNFKKF